MPDTARVVEALLFASGDPLTVRELAKAADADAAGITDALDDLRLRYNAASALQVVEVAGGWTLSTRPEYAPVVGKLLAPHANRLSKSALETVTIIAYRQPCTQAEIEAVRGVSVDGVLKTLMERELIADAGRRQVPGRPLLYVTTPQFLFYFGMTSLSELPPMDTDEEETAENAAAADAALTAAGLPDSAVYE